MFLLFYIFINIQNSCLDENIKGFAITSIDCNINFVLSRIGVLPANSAMQLLG